MNKPNAEDIYSLIGAALVQIQFLESLMKFCTTYVIQNGESIDFEGITKLEKQEKKKTLGYFIGQVKSRAEVHPNLLELLESFLDNRNLLVHNVDSIPSWDLETVEGTKAAKIFVSNLIRQTHVLTKIFNTLVIAWQHQEGFEIELNESDELALDHLQTEYLPIIDELFMKK